MYEKRIAVSPAKGVKDFTPEKALKDLEAILKDLETFVPVKFLRK